MDLRDQVAAHAPGRASRRSTTVRGSPFGVMICVIFAQVEDDRHLSALASDGLVMLPSGAAVLILIK